MNSNKNKMSNKIIWFFNLEPNAHLMKQNKHNNILEMLLGESSVFGINSNPPPPQTHVHYLILDILNDYYFYFASLKYMSFY